MRVNINYLFPTPVIEYNIGRNFTEQEINFMFSRDLQKNIYNSVSAASNILESEELINLKVFISKCLEDYVKVALIPNNDVSPYITESWINVTKPGESHHRHMHPNSIISGVLYVSADKEKDRINFFRKDNMYILNVEAKEHTAINSSMWWLQAKPGTLYLFPSTLTHEVEETTSESLRISLSFNTFLKGVIDNSKSSSLVLE
jgi:uncharacterized protein (TIGR02466 family)